MNTMLIAALSLAYQNIPVFPCNPKAKTPMTQHGFYDATTDEWQIRDWWHAVPEANVAMPTGHPGFDVLDVDIRASGSGLAALKLLEDEGLLEGRVRKVQTPSGGIHIYFRGSGLGKGNVARKHIDFQAAGGYVLVPPSYVVETTKGYEGSYVELEPFANTDTDEVLDWERCKRLLDPAKRVIHFAPRSEFPASDKCEHFVAWLLKQPEGNRNNALFWAACRIVERNGDLDPLEEAAISIGLDHEEVRKTIDSAMRRSK